MPYELAGVPKTVSPSSWSMCSLKTAPGRPVKMHQTAVFRSQGVGHRFGGGGMRLGGHTGSRGEEFRAAGGWSVPKRWAHLTARWWGAPVTRASLGGRSSTTGNNLPYRREAPMPSAEQYPHHAPKCFLWNRPHRSI